MEEYEELAGFEAAMYNVYKEIWQAAVGEVLICEREPHNIQDQYAVAVQKEVESSLDIYQGSYQACVQSFLRLRGTINCTVTGGRRYSRDLPKGGLEVPCFLLLKVPPKEIHKLKILLKK